MIINDTFVKASRRYEALVNDKIVVITILNNLTSPFFYDTRVMIRILSSL